jgi:hypothetical protein
MKRAYIVLTVWVLIISGMLPLIAQNNADGVVPRLVNYSGKAVDAQGKTLTGVAGVTFAIYKDQTDGAPLWLETQNVQADARGKLLRSTWCNQARRFGVRIGRLANCSTGTDHVAAIYM